MTDFYSKKGSLEQKELDEEKRRRLWLIIAVIITMAVIVGAWIWLLPYQLQNLDQEKNGSTEWDSVNSQLDQEVMQFKASLDALGKGLGVAYSKEEDVINNESNNKDTSEVVDIDTQTVVDRLQEKLEEESEKKNTIKDTGEVNPEL